MQFLDNLHGFWVYCFVKKNDKVVE